MALVPAYEVALGVWLLSGRMRFGAWLAALLTLTAFALHTLELTAAGRASCGCLGPGGPPPAVMLAVDLAAAAVLLKRRPGWTGWPEVTPGVRAAGLTAAVAVGTLAAAGGWAYARYGSVAVALADLNGDPLVMLPTAVDVGTADPGGVVERTVEIRNLSADPVQIAMATSGCRCTEFVGLPVTIPSGERQTLTVRVTVSADPGRFRRAGRFRSSAGDLRFTIDGWVRAGGQ
jgi:hypothetical protein